MHRSNFVALLRVPVFYEGDPPLLFKITDFYRLRLIRFSFPPLLCQRTLEKRITRWQGNWSRCPFVPGHRSNDGRDMYMTFCSTPSQRHWTLPVPKRLPCVCMPGCHTWNITARCESVRVTGDMLWCSFWDCAEPVCVSDTRVRRRKQPVCYKIGKIRVDLTAAIETYRDRQRRIATDRDILRQI